MARKSITAKATDNARRKTKTTVKHATRFLETDNGFQLQKCHDNVVVRNFSFTPKKGTYAGIVHSHDLSFVKKAFSHADEEITCEPFHSKSHTGKKLTRKNSLFRVSFKPKSLGGDPGDTDLETPPIVVIKG